MLNKIDKLKSTSKMVSQWRQIGMSYLQYSAICARAVRRCLKSEFKIDSSRLDQTNIKVTKWTDGKPGKAKIYGSQ
ncbi:ATP synthase subunit epsilon, mitochondrial-like [Xenia sp. Carnegie-2017]|uniref:ATP synthase subunit epsilon, mitochondrial-like n=1 Tax=Xenia sp. Carnegie-2017 TaxID=2897299 RepID=UPI001F0440A6|nr:ATP synthase subunit epsilon, mitochondrial-like [Xenia sp. Carnegie-2017]